MICISLTSKTHDALFEDMKRAKPLADMIEVRLDCLEERPKIGAILHAAPLPVIMTCRPSREGGRFSGDEQTRIGVLQKAIDLGADYVDVELDTVAKVERHGATRLITSYHNFEETPADLVRIYEKLLEK